MKVRFPLYDVSEDAGDRLLASMARTYGVAPTLEGVAEAVRQHVLLPALLDQYAYTGGVSAVPERTDAEVLGDLADPLPEEPEEPEDDE